MTIRRDAFQITVGKGGAASGDTGLVEGEFRQMVWVPNPADTGQAATLTLALIPDRTDTGAGFVFYSEAALNVGAGFVRAFDTGLPSRIVAQEISDNLRVDMVPGDTGMAFSGTLYLWMKED